MYARPALGQLPMAARGLGTVDLAPRALTRAQEKADNLRRIQQIFSSTGALGGVWTCDQDYVRQDSTGTTAAAVGAPVGLVFDQSRGMALGPELVDVANTATTWEKWGNNTIEQDGSSIKITYVDHTLGAYCYLTGVKGLTSNVVVGRSYAISFSAKTSSGTSSVGTYGGASFVNTGVGTEWTIRSGYAIATGTSPYLQAATAAGQSTWVRDISVREVIGNSAIQPTTANKPRYNRWPGTDIGWCMAETDATALTVTFPSSLGSACYKAVASVNGIKEYFNQTIGTTANLVDSPLFAIVILNRAPTPYEQRLILAWLRFYSPMAQPSLAAVQEIYAQGAVGGVWLPVEGALFATNDVSTPSAVGSSIGMVYDLSAGLVAGPELAAKANTAGNWTKYGNNTIAQDGYAVKITYVDNNQGGYAFLRQSGVTAQDLVVGQHYRVSAYMRTNGSSAPCLKIYGTTTTTVGTSNENYNIISVLYKADVSPYFFVHPMSSGDIVWLKDISIREFLGHHALQSNASYRPTLRQAPESRVWFSDVSPPSAALTATFPSTVGATCTAFRVTPNGVRKAVVSVSTTFNILDGQYTYWGGKVLVNGPTNQEQDAAILALMDQFVPGLGATVVANGTFDADSSWTKGTGWSIGSGIATKTAGTAANLTQAIATVGTIYWAGMDVTRTAGTIGAYPGSGTTQFGSQAATATDVWAVVLASGTGAGFRGDASFAGAIDNARWLPIL